MEPYILLIGAYERDNFGDLLYPKVLDVALSPYRNVKSSLMGRDLTGIGGDPVVSVRDHFRTDAHDPVAVIHCGGETLTCLRTHGVLMDLPPHILKELTPGCEEELSQKLLDPCDNPFAYLYGPSDLSLASGIPIAFTSIGGTSLYRSVGDVAFLSSLRARLEPAKYLSVRDRDTQRYLKEHLGVSARLHPDIVSILSRTHPSEVRDAAKHPQIARLVNGKPYILFQADSRTTEAVGVDMLGRMLARILDSHNAALVLQPAGLAGGHGDLEVDNEIARSVLRQNPRAQVSVQSNRHLWTQVATIANAACCIATSLHVRIVSLSFARPCVSLLNEKVTAYARTWTQDVRPYDVDPSELSRAVMQAMAADHQRLREASRYLIEEVEGGLKEMKAVLDLTVAKECAPEGRYPLELRTSSLETDRLREELLRGIVRRRALELEVVSLRQSRSWRFTVPFRFLARRVRGVRQLLQGQRQGSK